LIRPVKDENGVALIATLAVVAILLVLALTAGRQARDAAVRTASDARAFEAGELAWSGIHLAMLILARDGADNENDSVQESWADPEVIKAALTGMGLDPDVVTLSITDEMGKIQINALLSYFPGNDTNMAQRSLLELFFTLAGAGAKEDAGPVDKVNALKDWLDSRDDEVITGTSGAESDYYNALSPGYECANGPVRRLGQLAYVRGMHTLSWTFDGLGEAPKEVSANDVFTVFGLEEMASKSEKRFSFSGLININTAPVPVLAALMPEGLESLAQELASFRAAQGDDQGTFAHDLSSGWYKDVLTLNAKEKEAFENRITYASSIFRADCIVKTQEVRVHLSAVIKREKQEGTGKWSSRLIRVEAV